jgi:hypothetical protein
MHARAYSILVVIFRLTLSLSTLNKTGARVHNEWRRSIQHAIYDTKAHGDRGVGARMRAASTILPADVYTAVVTTS